MHPFRWMGQVNRRLEFVRRLARRDRAAPIRVGFGLIAGSAFLDAFTGRLRRRPQGRGRSRTSRIAHTSGSSRADVAVAPGTSVAPTHVGGCGLARVELHSPLEKQPLCQSRDGDSMPRRRQIRAEGRLGSASGATCAGRGPGLAGALPARWASVAGSAREVGSWRSRCRGRRHFRAEGRHYFKSSQLDPGVRTRNSDDSLSQGCLLYTSPSPRDRG